MERALQPGQSVHRFAWHDRKAWWQQEQGILAYLILDGIAGRSRSTCSYARESVGVLQRLLPRPRRRRASTSTCSPTACPYLLGTERLKGSHSMSGYHSFELCYLAAVYTNLLITKQPLDLYFKPQPGGFKDNILRVAPDILPPGSIKIERSGSTARTTPTSTPRR